MLLPTENLVEEQSLPQYVLHYVKLIPVSNIHEVLESALLEKTN